LIFEIGHGRDSIERAGFRFFDHGFLKTDAEFDARGVRRDPRLRLAVVERRFRL
jgi:hypothetical protein